MDKREPNFSIALLLLPVFFVVGIWGVYWLDWSTHGQWYTYGVLPRTISGLKGIFLSPLIHGGIRHLYNNSAALLVLLVLLQYFYHGKTWKVLFWGILLSGTGTWLIGRESYHIGASGLIYVLVSFMFFKGIQSRYYRLVALSLLIVMLYGSMVWYIFPDMDDQISWEGHLSGFVSGFLLSLFFKAPSYTEKTYKYEWQKPDYDASKDPFMQCFDEEGNFVILKEEQKEEKEEQHKGESDMFRSSLPVLYTYVKDKEKVK